MVWTFLSYKLEFMENDGLREVNVKDFNNNGSKETINTYTINQGGEKGESSNKNKDRIHFHYLIGKCFQFLL